MPVDRDEPLVLEFGDGARTRSNAEPLDSEAYETLRGLHDALLRYPMAAQAVFSALVAEGREFAATEEGAAMLRRLAHSKKTARARVIWEVLTMSSITERPTGALPGVFLDKLARTLVVEKLEPILARLFERRL